MNSGHLKETLMRVYDMRPSTAEAIMEIAEHISRIEKTEYAKGYAKGYADCEELAHMRGKNDKERSLAGNSRAGTFD